MRTLFGLSQPALLVGILTIGTLVVGYLAVVSWRNPLLPRLAWRAVPRRPGFAALITLGLTIGTIILSTAFTTGDTMSHSVRAVVAGVLGSADEVVFVPSAIQPSGFDLAQSIASGSLLTGATAPLSAADARRVADVLAGEPRVRAVVPILLDQVAASNDAAAFAARINVLGVDATAEVSQFEPADAPIGRLLSLDELGPDEVFANTEAAATLGVRTGERVRLVALPGGEDRTLTVRAVTRLGDLGGGQATLFVPLARAQDLLRRPDEVNQVLVLNRGDADQRLASSWPITVRLRAALADPTATARVFRALSSAPARDGLRRAIESPQTTGHLADKLRALNAALDDPAGPANPEAIALVNDPDVLSRLASRLGGTVQRGSTPFAAGVSGARAFRVLDVQAIAQDQADRWGSAFTDLFVVLGGFALFSGMLLIVLVFSLVALERRTELGISRALGARRRDVIALLALEGGLFSLLASVFGLAGGVGLALAILALAQGLVAQYGFKLEPSIEPTSLAVAFGIGVILTFGAVTLTTWRSSRFSIITAVRDLPDPPGGRPGPGGLVVSGMILLVGLALGAYGVSHRLSLAYASAVTVTIVGLALSVRWLLRRVGVHGERVVLTLAGLLLIVWWLAPGRLVPRVPLFSSDAVEMNFLGGVSILLGAVWVLACNVGFARRLALSAPLWRLSTAYVASNRFRTGLTLTMFALVVLSLTVSAVLLTATRLAYANPDAVTGGWDIHALSTRPPRDLRADLTAGGVLNPDNFSAIGVASTLSVEGIQIPSPAWTASPHQSRWGGVDLVAVDAAFAHAARTPLVAGDGRAWTRLENESGTAIVGAGLLSPAASSRLWIIAREGRDFRPTVVWIRDVRAPERAVRLNVIAIADGRGPLARAVVVNRATLAAAGWPEPDAGGYDFAIPPGANARDLAAGLNVALPDLTATTIADELRLVQGVRGLLSMILQGFMGVGLLAGVAALGTLSTRAVVERRRQIGVLRALGFSARSVSIGLLIESALIAALGAGLGVALGLVVADGTVAFLGRANPELRFAIPWDQIGLVVLVALAASTLMTLLPAYHAGRVTPAEALRDL